MRRSNLAWLCALSLLAGCAEGSDAGSVEQTGNAIIGGTVTSGFESVGALTYDGVPFCTGTVVAPRKVVTAAHCVVDLRPAEVKFVLGANAYSPETVLSVAALQPHPNYDDYNLYNDVGLVTLAADAPVAPSPMNSSMDASWVGRTLIFVGYGVTNGYRQTGDGPKRQVSIPIAEVGATQFAFGVRGKNTCNGDSGGPAFYPLADGRYLLVGTTSYGDEYCTQYGVDMRVDPYLGFFGVAAAEGEDEGEGEEEDPVDPIDEGATPETEPNNTTGSATVVVEPETFAGTISTATDRDYYRISLPAGRTLTVALDVPVGVDFDMALYNSSGSRLALSQNDVGQDEQLAVRNSAGSARVVYLRIYGYGGASSPDPYLASFTW